MLLDVEVVALLLLGCGGSGVARLGRCALGLFRAELQLDFDQVVVAVESGAREGVNVVYDVPKIFVYNSVI